MNEELIVATQLEIYLQQNPQKVKEIVSALVSKVQLLELQVQTLIEDNHQLTSQLIEMYEIIPTPKTSGSISLPSFLKCHCH